MNKPAAVNNVERFEAKALELLRKVPGVTAVETEVPIGNGRRVDGIVRFAGTDARVVFEIKRHANAAAAWQLIEYAKRLGVEEGYQYVLVAGDTTKEARALLVEHGIGLVDGLGNAHVELPGLLLHMEQQARKIVRAHRPAVPRLAGKAGAVAQAILLDPLRAWKVADVAVLAGVSPALAHRVLARLETEGVMTTQGKGPALVRQVPNPAALLDLWAEETTDGQSRRIPAFLLAQTPDRRLKELAKNLDAQGVDYAVTGAAAAKLVAPFVTAVPTTEVWVGPGILTVDLLQAAGAEPVEDGANVVFLQAKDNTPLAFRQRNAETWIVNVFRLYADLRRDPRRGREQADNLRTEVIGF